MIIACVRTGPLYPITYVAKLRSMVARYMSEPFRLVCLTDMPERVPGVEFIDVRETGLNGWWAKMALFRKAWRAGEDVLFIDLDTVINGPFDALYNVDAEFAICANFARAAGNTNWPCKYGSCVMYLDRSLGEEIWNVFAGNSQHFMTTYARTGDQRAIEDIYPGALLFQSVLPEGFFLNYRDMKGRRPPAETALIVFGGNHKPHNSPLAWVGEVWR